ncbi:MAG: HAD family hydrolase [Beijerinckiaceae bacterium]
MTGLVIYDCDGTLIDSERIVANVCLMAIHDLGLTSWTMDDYVSSFVGMPGVVGWGRVREALGRDFPDGFNECVDAQIDARFAVEPLAIPGVREAVHEIGGVRCVASTTRIDHLRKNIALAGLHDLFGEAVYSASQVRRPKPAPDVFLHAAAQMGHDPCDCIVVEDSIPGVRAAVRAGMRVIGFTGVAHAPDIMADRLLAEGVLAVAGGMAELPAVVGKLRASR